MDAFKHQARLASQAQAHFGHLAEGSKSSSLSHTGLELVTSCSHDFKTDALHGLSEEFASTLYVFANTLHGLD